MVNILRAGEWWEYKLVPIFCAFYATAVTLDVPVASLWLTAITVLASIVPGAAYVSVINDITDRRDDLAAGKANRLAGKRPALLALLVAAPVAAGLVFFWLWRQDRLLLIVYGAAWLAFSLYSLPPFRWKVRGIFGVLCDASGAHLFPTLVAVVLAFRGAGRIVDPLWLASAGLWSFAYGLRGILWHQLSDRDNDRNAGVRTFAQRHAPQVAMRLGAYVAFPLELLAIAALVWQSGSLWPAVLLGVYAFLTVRRMRIWHMQPVVVAPKERYFIVLHEYYDVFFPFALLFASALAHPIDWIVLVVHFLLFPLRAKQTLHDLRRLGPRRIPGFS